jgi:2-dehydro-3-deoxygluconokinase
MARFVCFGEILIRLSAPAGELMLQTPRLDTAFGGAETNVAVSLARLGHHARIASVLPDNALGHAALSELQRYGADTSLCAFGGGRMGLYFATPGAGPRAAEILYDRADSAFARAPEKIDWSKALAGADWLHVSGATPALNAKCADAALDAMRAARAAGAKVSFDANFRAKLWEARGDDPRPTLDALFDEADLMFAEERDIGLVTGERPASDEDAARIAFARYPKLQRLAATKRKVLSADAHELSGVSFTRAGVLRTRAHAITGIVDRIGGGDAFAAGVLHGLASGLSDQHMLDFAVGAAVLKHTIRGDFSLATAADVDFYLSNSGSDVRR